MKEITVKQSGGQGLEQVPWVKTKACKALVETGVLLPPGSLEKVPLESLVLEEKPEEKNFLLGGGVWSSREVCEDLDSLLARGWRFPEGNKQLSWKQAVKASDKRDFLTEAAEGGIDLLATLAFPFDVLLAFLMALLWPYYKWPWASYLLTLGGVFLLSFLLGAALEGFPYLKETREALPPVSSRLTGPKPWQDFQRQLDKLPGRLQRKEAAVAAAGLSTGESPLLMTYKQDLLALLRKAQEGGLLAEEAGEPLEDLLQVLQEEAAPYLELKESLGAALRAQEEAQAKKEARGKAQGETEEAALKQAAEEAVRSLVEWEDSHRKQDALQAAEALKEGVLTARKTALQAAVPGGESLPLSESAPRRAL